MDPFNQLFTDARDVLTDEDMVEELYYSHMSKHPIHVLNRASGTDLYGDPAAEPVYDQTIELPILVKLNPQEVLLDKYGMDKRRDAIIWFARKICLDQSYEPSIGDRIDFTFRTPSRTIVNEHLIITNVAPWDFQRQLTDHYGFVAGAERTQKKYKPDPPNEPEAPASLAYDQCLRDL